MNLDPATKELAGTITALQDFINDVFEDLKSSDYPISPEEFTLTMQTHFCDFLDSTHSVEKVLEQTIEKISTKYENSYNKDFGLAKVYNIADYRKVPMDHMTEEEVTDFLLGFQNHPSNYRNDIND